MWNNGWAYGARHVKLSSALLIGTASGGPDSYSKRGYDEAMRVQLNVGIMDYCGIPKTHLEIMYDVMQDDATRRALLDRARHLGATYF